MTKSTLYVATDGKQDLWRTTVRTAFRRLQKSLRPSITRGGGCELKNGGGAGAARREGVSRCTLVCGIGSRCGLRSDGQTKPFRGLSSLAHHPCRNDADVFERAVVVVGGHALYLVDHGEPFHHFAEHGVLAVEMRRAAGVFVFFGHG